MEKQQKCHDCSRVLRKGQFYHNYKNGRIKCKRCHQKDPVLRNFQPTEVYSRVVGYIRQVAAWNPGKKAEFKDRKVFKSK